MKAQGSLFAETLDSMDKMDWVDLLAKSTLVHEYGFHSMKDPAAYIDRLVDLLFMDLEAKGIAPGDTLRFSTIATKSAIRFPISLEFIQQFSPIYALYHPGRELNCRHLLLRFFDTVNKRVVALHRYPVNFQIGTQYMELPRGQTWQAGEYSVSLFADTDDLPEVARGKIQLQALSTTA